jgi:hypothetical protein
MTLPRRALAKSGYGGRGYRPLGHKDLPVLPSVTTILKVENKPALVQWAADQTAAFAVANAETLFRMSDVKAWGFLRFFHKREPKDPLSEKFTELTSYHTGVLSDAGSLGDSVHEWVEADLSGYTPFPDVANRNAAFWQCVNAWNDFKAKHDIVFHRTECTVWNPDDGYAGTFDLLLEIDGVMYLIDIKTSRGLYSSTWMQLAALYKAPSLLDDSITPGTDQFLHDWQKPIRKLGVIHIRPDDDDGRAAFCELVEIPGDVDLHYQSFLGLRQYLGAQKELGQL